MFYNSLLGWNCRRKREKEVEEEKRRRKKRRRKKRRGIRGRGRTGEEGDWNFRVNMVNYFIAEEGRF